MGLARLVQAECALLESKGFAELVVKLIRKWYFFLKWGRTSPGLSYSCQKFGTFCVLRMQAILDALCIIKRLKRRRENTDMKDTNNKQKNTTTITVNLNNNSLSVISICLYMYVFCHKNDELFICLFM